MSFARDERDSDPKLKIRTLFVSVWPISTYYPRPVSLESNLWLYESFLFLILISPSDLLGIRHYSCSALDTRPEPLATRAGFRQHDAFCLGTRVDGLLSFTSARVAVDRCGFFEGLRH